MRIWSMRARYQTVYTRIGGDSFRRWVKNEKASICVLIEFGIIINVVGLRTVKRKTIFTVRNGIYFIFKTTGNNCPP